VSKAGRPTGHTVYVCQQCGRESLQWLGKCPGCQQWNTLVETSVAVKPRPARKSERQATVQELADLEVTATDRLPLALGELDRVLGGGLVPGSLVLVGGEPGIGKSTLLLQVAALAAGARQQVVYVSGEETQRQIKLRANRLGIRGDSIFLIAETDLSVIMTQLEGLSPGLVIIDSIQSVSLPELEGAAGSIAQVRECTMRLMHWAKGGGATVLITGHVTKEGAIAGPRTLEHIVDVVLYLEGESFSAHRLLRCVKNRFGSTNEIGVFEMKEPGLVEVANPSQVFLSQHGGETVGSIVVPVLLGSRPLLIEVQALTNPTAFGLPRRTANGVDFNRLVLIAAVLSRRVGLHLGNQDILVNLTGGVRVDEPAADLGIALAIASSFRDAPLDPLTAAVGEIGLSGELRPVAQLERRVNEAARLGFKRCLLPRAGDHGLNVPVGMQLVPAATLREAVRLALGAVKSEPPDQVEG